MTDHDAWMLAQEDWTAEQEREAIVAWVKHLTPEQFGWAYFGDLDDDMLGHLASKISSGAHLGESKK